MGRKKILWVEDDPGIVTAFKPSLSSHSWDVVSVPSAEKGKAIAKSVRPDLIIMDVIMEKEHGFDAIEDIKKEPTLANIPIIIFTGVTRRWGETTATRQDGLLTQADEFIDKLEKPDVLINTIGKYLGK